jgi:fused signal recognition particle receptor
VTIFLIAVAAVVVVTVVVTLVIRSRGAGSSRAPVEAPPAAPPRLRERMGRTRRALVASLSTFGTGRGPDAAFWDSLEDALVASDVGVAAAGRLVSAVKQSAPGSVAAARAALEAELARSFSGRDRQLGLEGAPAVILVVGVNGGGKTTSIAKLARLLQRRGSSVLLGAADTFRAAADQQLRTWADRVAVDLVSGQEGADPASVAFDAFRAAQAREVDVVIVDTAGRLQTKTNLMDELAKVARVLRREAGRIDEVLLVIDGTTGQNAIAQARQFADAVGVTGIVITKLDGTARGGVVVAIEEELGIPVKFIGVGEAMEDLIRFEPDEFVSALVGS